MSDRRLYVYVMMNKWRTASYIGVTSNLIHRVWQHREGVVDGYTSRYRCYDLIYFEEFDDARNAIEREKEIKKWRRDKKLELIKSMNPELDDLSHLCVV